MVEQRGEAVAGGGGEPVALGVRHLGGHALAVDVEGDGRHRCVLRGWVGEVLSAVSMAEWWSRCQVTRDGVVRTNARRLTGMLVRTKQASVAQS